MSDLTLRPHGERQPVSEPASAPSLLGEIVAILQRTGLDPRNLNLEITESVVMSDAPANTATLDKLRELGIELVIDDFGTGYSSLSYLKQFPVSYLKVDRSFVEELREGFEDRAVVWGIIALAHTLGIRVIAEGVESAEQLRILRELGCDMAQGYYFSEPLTHEETSALLAADPRWWLRRHQGLGTRSATRALPT